MSTNENKKEKSCYLYRVISFQRLIDILVNKKNTLVNPSKWADPFEGWILKNKQSNKESECNFFGQCWTSETISEAIWRVNSHEKDGFRIRTTIDSLWDSLRKIPGREDMFCKIGKIEYLERDEIREIEEGDCEFNINILKADGVEDIKRFPKNISNLIDGFMIKRLGYRYESEIRLICYSSKEERDGMKRYCICPNKVIDQILIHPRVDDHELCRLESTLEKLDFKGIIKKSELDHMDDD